MADSNYNPTPCDYYPFECPYNATRWSECEYYCKCGVYEEPDMDYYAETEEDS